MAHGLQVWNAAGNILLDSTTYTGRFINQSNVMTTTSLAVGIQTGTISVTKNSLQKIWVSALQSSVLGLYVEIDSIDNTASQFVYKYYNLHYSPAQIAGTLFWGIY